MRPKVFELLLRCLLVSHFVSNSSSSSSTATFNPSAQLQRHKPFASPSPATKILNPSNNSNQEEEHSKHPRTKRSSHGAQTQTQCLGEGSKGLLKQEMGA
mmetsp:Transcript_10732/g.16831  ORF Transcript_10732/g.16831 Transcript_10732/m.16831 type:complete len:100 (+) Transcript_10732:90-389(+)